MKNFFVLAFACLSVISCKKDNQETKTETSEKQNIPAFDDATKDLSVKDLMLTTGDDTISYALGVAWANGIAKVGLNKISFAFYNGVHDYMVQNKTFTNVKEAGERLDKEIEYLKRDSLHVLDINQKLEDIEMSSKYDTLSYQLGYAWTRGAKEYGINKITPALLAGLTKGLKGDTTLFNYPKADRYLRRHVEKQRETQFADIKAKNEQWLAENKLKKDIITLPSGLQYKVLKEGKGKSPQADQVVVCHYTAKLIDNTTFENTYNEGAPLKAFPSGVIPAWREALPKMKTGSTWEIYVPYKLGYGSGGVKDKVPPFATLIYQIELLKVEDQI